MIKILNIEFRKLIKFLRKREEDKATHEKVTFLPYDFNSLLDYLSMKSQREKLISQVENSKFALEECSQDIKVFNKLFRLKASGDDLDIDLPIKKEVKLRY